MSRRLEQRFVANACALVALLALCACGPGQSVPPPGLLPDYFVDPINGSDAASGAFLAPFKTLTHATSVATQGAEIRVRPGRCTTATGEVFPIVIPRGVSVVGNEGTKGTGVDAVVVEGSGPVPPWDDMATFDMHRESRLAGIWGINPDASPDPYYRIVARLRDKDIEIRNCTLQGTTRITSTGILVSGIAGRSTIRGNVIEDLGGIGIYYVGSSGNGALLEDNLIRGNNAAVKMEGGVVDLGGGPQGSMGGNVFADSLGADLIVFGATVHARQNAWDNVPPVIVYGPVLSTGGDDVWLWDMTATIDVTGATLAP